MNMYYSTSYSSPLGELLIISDGKSLTDVSFTDSILKNKKTAADDDLDIFKKVNQWFDNYFEGSNPRINFTLNPEVSEFREKVLKIVSEIPYGETMTYGEIALRISPAMSAQAVGQAVAANPIAIIIPCHRVIGRNNQLTGYAAGIDKKAELLKLENIEL